jgi:hypothetical protein
MKLTTLKSRGDVVSEIIEAYPGGRAGAAALFGWATKKFDNHAYESANSRPLTEDQIFRLEQVTNTTYLAQYVARLYGGIFVPVTDPEHLDNVELYTQSVQAAALRGTVDQIIAKALDDGVITRDEAESIMTAHNANLAARHAEVLSVIKLHSSKDKRP